uniref:SH2 domain protein n=1 Tax=Panagrellus redivivus TaxID=6233 RepID=A0A7E4UUA6_PANRE
MDDDWFQGGYWKQNLYLLQEKAPRPIPVRCVKRIFNRPECYGDEFHGLIERPEAEMMLKRAGEGAFLVRASKRSANAYTLCILFDNNVLNYKLFFDGLHYVGEKRFETVELLVADGLIHMFIDKHASDYIKRMADEAIYEQSPYSQYNRNDEEPQVPRIKSPKPRKHNFSSCTFKIPHYCDFCRNFMWGLVQQGVRCSDCGFAAHKRCSEQARHDCRPEAKYVKRMFAVDLSTLCMAHSVRVPPVLVRCIEEIEKRALDVEGIYRVSGSHEQMEKLRRQFDLGNNVDLSTVEDVHTVCGLLKLYLRLLPQQLVPYSVFRALLHAYSSNSNDTKECIRKCRAELEELNEANAFTLNVLLEHLRHVSQHSTINKMTPENLATIFSPTIFCAGETPALPQQQHQLLFFLITTPRVLPPAFEL